MFHKLSNNSLECFIFTQTNLEEENSFGNKKKFIMLCKQRVLVSQNISDMHITEPERIN